MRAMVIDEYGPPDVLHMAEVPKPTPGPDDVLIRVHATQVAAADYRVRGSNFPAFAWLPARMMFGLRRPKFRILGGNFAGEVTAVGSNVRRFDVGDRVFGSTSGKFGAYAEFLCIPDDTAMTKMPAGMTYEEAAAIPFGALTATFWLRDKCDIKPGQDVLIYGASGAVGTAAVQLAKHFGAAVTGVCSTANAELVESLGADRVIDYTKTDFTKEGRRYDVIFETVGKSSVAGGMGVLKDNGIYLANAIGMSTLAQMLRYSVGSSKKIIGTVARFSREDLEFIRDLYDAGEFKAVIDRSYPFEEMPEAHRYADTGHKKGNVVVMIEHEG
ncbi:MAG: NAD(P)-dependent alcohol dehydrogenase [Thermomicrobiales bacterium]